MLSGFTLSSDVALPYPQVYQRQHIHRGVPPVPSAEIESDTRLQSSLPAVRLTPQGIIRGVCRLSTLTRFAQPQSPTIRQLYTFNVLMVGSVDG